MAAGDFLKITMRKTGDKFSIKNKGIDGKNLNIEELKLTAKEEAELKHDILEVQTSMAQCGLTVLGLIPGWGEPCDVASASLDFATGHPIAGTISLFCACPVAGWLGDVPLIGVRIYRIVSSTFKCGKTIFVIAKNNNRVGKIFIWFNRKVVSANDEVKEIRVIQKNIFDDKSSSLYRVFSQIEKHLKLKNNDFLLKVKSYKYNEFNINLKKWK